MISCTLDLAAHGRALRPAHSKAECALGHGQVDRLAAQAWGRGTGATWPGNPQALLPDPHVRLHDVHQWGQQGDQGELRVRAPRAPHSQASRRPSCTCCRCSRPCSGRSCPASGAAAGRPRRRPSAGCAPASGCAWPRRSRYRSPARPAAAGTAPCRRPGGLLWHRFTAGSVYNLYPWPAGAAREARRRRRRAPRSGLRQAAVRPRAAPRRHEVLQRAARRVLHHNAQVLLDQEHLRAPPWPPHTLTRSGVWGTLYSAGCDKFANACTWCCACGGAVSPE